ncbi:MAG: anaerobic C4-dicarboxylate transporter [Propionibacteriaceae bacterium]|jgi:anaerobic C4-dicarboxylate transporter DcuA|nr:anaerobic C4-dicarboxylate transporter [Propionibacteriaceae bacterium]
MGVLTLVLQLLILFGAIFLGARLGGIAIGFAGGIGVLLLGATGLKTDWQDYIPFDVVGIILSVIGAIAAMQVAGGIDFLVGWADRMLRKRPQSLTIVAPLITYLMTVLAGTGHTAFSTLPVIAEVAKENNIRPSRPLAISVVSSQIAVTASPVSAAVAYLAGALEDGQVGIGYLQLLAVSIPASLAAVLVAALIVNWLDRTPLDQDPEYLKRRAEGRVVMRGATAIELKPKAKASVAVFITAVGLVMLYAVVTSDRLSLIQQPAIDHTSAIIAIMLATAAVIVVMAKIDPAEILNAPTFKAGMSAAICVLGVAWLGTVFIQGHMADITALAGDVLRAQPWLLAVVLFLAATLLYSQAATAKAIMPIAFSVGLSPLSIVASFAAASALFVLPTYPTLIAAVEMDDTGSTRIGKYVFDHPFLAPGLLTVGLAVAFGFGLGSLIL